MEVVSLSSLPVASVAWQPTPGSTTLTVICRATFTLEPSESPLADQQEPIRAEDRVVAPASAGVVLVGPGFAHGGQPGRASVAHIVVGEIDSRLEIKAETLFNEELGPLASIRPDERLLLENLHVEHPRLLTRLPGVRPFAFLDRLGAPQRLGFEADTLWIDTARGICTLTFRVAIPLRAPEEQGAVLVLLAQAGTEPTWADIPPRRFPMLTVDDLAVADEIEGPMDDVEGPLDDLAWPAEGEASDPENERHESLPTQRPPALTIPFDLAHVDDLKLPGLPFSTRAGLTPLPPRPPPPPPSREAMGTPPSAVLPFRASRMGVTVPTAPVSTPPQGLPPPIPPPRHSEPVRVARTITAPPPQMAPPQMPSPPMSSRQMPSPPMASRPMSSPPMSSSPLSPPQIPPLQMPSPPLSSPQIPPLQMSPPPLSSSTGVSSVHASGVFFASASAAAVSEPWFARRADQASSSAPMMPLAREPLPRAEPDGAVQLVFHDTDSMPRIRRTSRWRSILLDLEKRPPDPDLEDPAFAKDPAEVEDRREIFEILARGTPAIAIEVNEALVAAVRDDGKLVPPLLLVGGELQLPFDEIETLRATVTTVTPLAGNDENLRAAIDVARQFLAIPGLATAPAVAEGLTTRIREAWSQGKRMVAPGYLDAQTDRALIEQRHYQRRTVFGGKHLRALLHAGGNNPIPAYLPESAAKVLPLYPRFKVRLVAEVHLQIDPYETNQIALRGLALARVSPLPKR